MKPSLTPVTTLISARLCCMDGAIGPQRYSQFPHCGPTLEQRLGCRSVPRSFSAQRTL